MQGTVGDISAPTFIVVCREVRIWIDWFRILLHLFVLIWSPPTAAAFICSPRQVRRLLWDWIREPLRHCALLFARRYVPKYNSS